MADKFSFQYNKGYFLINKFFGSSRKEILVVAIYEGFVTVYGLEVEAGGSWFHWSLELLYLYLQSVYATIFVSILDRS